jgi:heme-degrading monooxygenase HmoA
MKSFMSDRDAECILIWEFRVRPGFEADFEKDYGKQGAWAVLFRSGRGYLGTELLRDPATPRRYLTIDRWSGADAFSRFREEYGDEYARLDARCEPWTEQEIQLGAWSRASR